MSKYNLYEERILRVLVKSRRKLTTSEVSKFSGISYNTTKKYLERLNNKGYIKKRNYGNRIYWWI